MTADTPNVSLPLTKVFFRGYLTFGLDARDLHSSLAVAKNFPAWIASHIASGNFLENQDFIVRRLSEGASLVEGHLDYFVSIDMAKALAISEPQGPARTATRRFLLNAERGTRAGKLASYRPSFDRDLDELVAMQVREIVARSLPDLLSELIIDRRIQVRYGKTSGQIWQEKGFPPLRRIYRWFGNRLQQAGCLVHGNGYGELGNTRARLFDPDKVNQWLAAGGRKIVEQKLLEVIGQGVFDFSTPPACKGSTPPPPATRAGCGARRLRR